MAVLGGAASASGAFDSIMIYGISHMQGIGGLKAWQWTFLLESLPNIPLGIFAYLLLDKVPNAVQWLSNMEKQFLTNLLRNDAGVADNELSSDSRLSKRQMLNVFTDWRIYLYSLIGLGNLIAVKCMTTLLPTLVTAAGYTKTQTHLITAIPYVFACICGILIGYSSSRRNEHGYHLILCFLVVLLGFILILTLPGQSKVTIIISTTVVCCGIFSALPLLLSWLTNNVGGHTKRSMAISLVMGIGQIGGIFQPLIYRDVDGPTYRRGHLICSAMILVSIITTIILRICLRKENNRRENLSLEQYRREASIKESCDLHPDARYSL
ncbi:unnamed protein product [Rotaria sp. Silwood2]|nr:unnamed protein product [Rotaria sp. Silwood2]